MLTKSNWKKFVVLLISCVLVCVFVFLYICGDGVCGTESNISPAGPGLKKTQISVAFDEYRNGRLPYNKFDQPVVGGLHHVDFDDEDVLVFLHIQKTGGTTFGRHLVRNLDIKYPM